MLPIVGKCSELQPIPKYLFCLCLRFGFGFKDKISLCCLGWSGTHYVVKTGPVLRYAKVSAYQELGLKAYITMHSLKDKSYFFKGKEKAHKKHT